MMMANVLFISHSAELNGSELMLLQTLEKIDQHKYKSYLVIPRFGPLAEKAQEIGLETEIIPIKWWLTERKWILKQPFAWLWNLKSILQISRMIDRSEIDLVFSNSSASFSGALAAKIKGLPHIWAIHEIFEEKDPLLRFLLGKRALIRLVTALSTRIVVNSLASQRAFGNLRKVCLVYNGIGMNREDHPSRNILRKQFALKKQDFVVGTVGKICEKKGQMEIISAVASLSLRFPQLKLLVVGEAKNRRYLLRLQKKVEQLRLEDRIIFSGYRRDIFNVLRMMDLFISASRIESFGRTVIEAMAVRTPVLALRTGGIPEIIDNERNGFLMKSRNPDDISKKVEFMIKNPIRTAEIAEEGYRTVRERFSLENQVKKIEQVLKKSLELN